MVVFSESAGREFDMLWITLSVAGTVDDVQGEGMR